MKKFLIALLLPILAYLIIGCGGAGIKNTWQITGEELQAKIDAEEEFVLLDVREEVSWDQLLPGAFNLPRGRLEFEIDSKDYWDTWAWEVPHKDDEIIIYCRKGTDASASANCVDVLKRMGYTNVKYLYGGWYKWEKGPEAFAKMLEEESKPRPTGGCGG